MKQILIEIDDRCARDLQRVAPAKKRVRAEFIRLALRHAIDIALDRATESAYRTRPLGGGVDSADLVGWDTDNKLARLGARRRKAPRRRTAKTKNKAA